MDVSKATDCQ
jgi:hypothetical protein